MADRVAFLVEELLAGGQGHDLGIEQAGSLGGGGALLALQRVGVLGLRLMP